MVHTRFSLPGKTFFLFEGGFSQALVVALFQVAVVQGGAAIWTAIRAQIIGAFSEIQKHNGIPTIVSDH